MLTKTGVRLANCAIPSMPLPRGGVLHRESESDSEDSDAFTQVGSLVAGDIRYQPVVQDEEHARHVRDFVALERRVSGVKKRVSDEAWEEEGGVRKQHAKIYARKIARILYAETRGLRRFTTAQQVIILGWCLLTSSAMATLSVETGSLHSVASHLTYWGLLIELVFFLSIAFADYTYHLVLERTIILTMLFLVVGLSIAISVSITTLFALDPSVWVFGESEYGFASMFFGSAFEHYLPLLFIASVVLQKKHTIRDAFASLHCRFRERPLGWFEVRAFWAFQFLAPLVLPTCFGSSYDYRKSYSTTIPFLTVFSVVAVSSVIGNLAVAKFLFAKPVRIRTA